MSNFIYLRNNAPNFSATVACLVSKISLIHFVSVFLVCVCQYLISKNICKLGCDLSNQSIQQVHLGVHKALAKVSYRNVVHWLCLVNIMMLESINRKSNTNPTSFSQIQNLVMYIYIYSFIQFIHILLQSCEPFPTILPPTTLVDQCKEVIFFLLAYFTNE